MVFIVLSNRKKQSYFYDFKYYRRIYSIQSLFHRWSRSCGIRRCRNNRDEIEIRSRARSSVLQQAELRDAAVDRCNFRNESSYKSRGPATCAPAKLQLSGAGCNLSVMLLTIEVIGCTIIIPWVSSRSWREGPNEEEGGGTEGVAEAVMNAFTAWGAREKTLIIPDNIAG